MRIENCERNIGDAISAPLEHPFAESEWQEARDKGRIPAALFELYVRSGYLSFGCAPTYLRDQDHILFSYFASVMRSIMEPLVEAHEELALFHSLHDKGFDPTKRGEPFDTTVDTRAQRHFRNFVFAVFSALDSVAELVAVIITGKVPSLRVGSAQFSRIEIWLKEPLSSASLIVTPQQHYAELLYNALHPVVVTSGSDEDWLRLARLIRNKATHIGSSIFRAVGLAGNDGRMYRFFAREWPMIWERHIKPANPRTPRIPSEVMLAPFMHQDTASYATGLMAKVTVLIEAAVTVIEEAYRKCSDEPFNAAALNELESNAVSTAFESFANG